MDLKTALLTHLNIISRSHIYAVEEVNAMREAIEAAGKENILSFPSTPEIPLAGNFAVNFATAIPTEEDRK